MPRRWAKIRKGLLKALLPVLRFVLPPKVASRVVGVLGRAEYALNPGARLRYDRAIRQWGHHFGARWDVRRVGRELAANELRWQARDLLLDGLDPSRITPLFMVSGREHLDAAREAGRGVILLGNHFGAHLLPAHWLLREGYPLRLFMERPRFVSKFLAKQFRTDGPLGQDKLFISRKAGTTEAAGSILRAARVLKAGMILNLAGDVRWSGPNTATASFLGRVHSFSATWAILAAMTGAPVVPVFCRMDRDGTYHLEFEPAYQIPADAPGRGALGQWVQACLGVIERRVHDDPANSNEYASWSEVEATVPEAA